MNPEMSNPEMLFSAPPDAKRGDLSAEQKEALTRAWSDLVVENVDVPENTKELSREEIKNWLFESTMKDVGRLADKWGLQANTELIQKIQATENLDEKSALELAYIRASHAQVDRLTKEFDKTKSAKWDSWPKRMRETGRFNCVGATLLGLHFLEQGGVKSYYGNPYEHVANIVQLSNGEWWYVDFRNGPQNIIKIEPEETIINGVRVLKINQPEIDYQLIPIYNNQEAAGSVLGNLSALKHEAEDPAIAAEDKDKQAAIEYLASHRMSLSDDELNSLSELLYPDFQQLSQAEELRQEQSRIKAIYDFDGPIQAYTDSLTTEQLSSLIKELRAKKDLAEEFIRSGDESLLTKTSEQLRALLKSFRDTLESISNKQSEVYKEAIDRIIAKIRR